MGYYDTIASGYDELHGEEQRAKIAVIKEHVSIPQDASLLDVGCGTGISTSCWSVNDATGIDPSSGLLAIAKEKYPHPSFIQGNAETLPFPDKHFDWVVSLTAIQNFTNARAGLREIKRVGKKTFILSILKKSTIDIKPLIDDIFSELDIQEIHQDKDTIYLITP